MVAGEKRKAQNAEAQRTARNKKASEVAHLQDEVARLQAELTGAEERETQGRRVIDELRQAVAVLPISLARVHAYVPRFGKVPEIIPEDLEDLFKASRQSLPLTSLLEAMQTATDGNGKALSLKLSDQTKGILDVTSNTANEVTTGDIMKQLAAQLHLPAEDMQLCTDLAVALSISSAPAAGVYLRHNVTPIHAHLLGVLNWLFAGSKIWRLWKPGRRPCTANKEDVTLTQDAGKLLWIPPGWWHEVTTWNTEPLPEGLSRMRSVGKEGVAYGVATWYLPAELRDYAYLNMAFGMTEEKQLDRKQTPEKGVNAKNQPSSAQMEAVAALFRKARSAS
jgi:hypothetical protein